MTNDFICDLLWKVQKNHAANREGSFNETGKELSLPYMYLIGHIILSTHNTYTVQYWAI